MIFGRFLKGTTDHDGDGRMGGSKKGKTMTKPKAKAKAPARKAEPKPAISKAATEHPAEYEAGRRAARSAVPKDQAPVFYTKDAEKAWNEGHDSFNG